VRPLYSCGTEFSGLDNAEDSMRLTDHFSLDEFTHSQTATRRGIDNTPDKRILDNLKHTAQEMEKVRVLLGWPIYVSSGYRCPELNKAIGGSDTSQHMSGEAVDFVCPDFGIPLNIANKIASSDIDFDQLIYEGTWVHISFLAPRRPRRDIMTWKLASGYTPGINV